ncbi:MAG: DNA repair protein RadC [Thermaerobacter sp.]|nr:DNA repair protein RadC [Thermaerobacter sp.]
MKDLPAAERPRERLLAGGAGVLSDAELLGILIGSGTRTATAVELGQRLLSGGSLRAVASLSGPELLRVSGLGPAKVARLLAALELGRRLATWREERTLIRGAGDAARLLMERMRYLEQEHFQTIALDTRHRVLAVETVCVGSLAAVPVHPRDIFKGPIRRNAAAVILAHNHPSGDPTPSTEDKDLTRRLGRAGRLLGIEVLDHLVIGENRYVSLREQGLEWGF